MLQFNHCCYYLSHLFHKRANNRKIRKSNDLITIRKQCPFTIHIVQIQKTNTRTARNEPFRKCPVINESKCNSERDKCVFDFRRWFSLESCSLLLLLSSKKGEIDLIYQMIAINRLLNSKFGNKWWWLSLKNAQCSHQKY